MAHLNILNLRNSTPTSLTSWNNCFLCSSQLPPAGHIPESPETRRRRSQKRRPFLVSSDFTILFKYLLHSCNDPLLQNSLLNCPSEHLSRVKLCSSCNKAAETMKEQHLLLEVIQMKIIDSLKTLKSKIVSNSRLFGTNGKVLETFQVFESSLAEQEKQGINCDQERKLLELILALQTFVSENNGKGIQIPLVFLEKFVGVNKTPGGENSERLEVTKKKKPKTHVFEVKPEPEIIPPPPSIKEEVHQDWSNPEDCEELFDDDDDDPPNDTNDSDFRISSESEDECSKDADWANETSRKKPRTERSRTSPIIPDEKPKPRRVRPPTPKIAGMPKKKKVWKKKAQSCEMCDFSTRDVFNLEAHLREHETNEKNHPCPKCDLSFTSNQYLELHQTLRHDKTRTRKCDICESMILISKLEEHILKDHGQDQIFPCDLCDHFYGTYQGLLRHFERHRSSSLREVRKLKCRLCPEPEAGAGETEEFTFVPLLIHLANSHESFSDLLIKSKHFATRKGLRSHRARVHKNDNKAEQDDHRNEHEETKCDLCGERFYNKWQVENHQSKEHGIDYQCADCDDKGEDEIKRFATRKGLRSHRARVHKNNNKEQEDQRNEHEETSRDFTCEICGFASTSMRLLEKHKLCHEERTEEELNQELSNLEDCVEPFDDDDGDLRNDTNDPDFHVSSESEDGISKDADWKDDTTSPKRPRLAHRRLPPPNSDDEPKAGQSKSKPKPATSAPKRKKKPQKLQLCESCDFSTKQVYIFEAHLREHERDEDKLHPCPKCDLSFTTKQYFELHQTLQHAKNRIRKCDVCDKMILIPKLEEHFRKDHGNDEIFSCHLCDHLYGSYLGLITHFDRHRSGTSKVRRTKCRLCPEPETGQEAKLFSIHLLRRHLVESHEGYSNLVMSCEYPHCEQTFVDKAAYRFHKMVHEKRYACDQCEKIFRDKYSLQNHVKYVHKGEKMKYECDLCGKSFGRKCRLENHQCLEHGIGYECEYCGVDEGGEKVRFDTRPKLKSHRLKVHPVTFEVIETKERGLVHQCPDCGKMFDMVGNLNQHRKIHIQTRDFFCEMCGFATKSALLLREHKKRHDDKTKFKCQQCPKTFASMKRLRVHLVLHSDEKPYQCDLCGREFRHSSSFCKHKKRHLTNPKLHKHRGGDIGKKGKVKQEVNLPELPGE